VDGRENIGSDGLESGGEQLGHNHVTVAIHDERWQPVPFGMHDAIRRRVDSERGTALGRSAQPPNPPSAVDDVARPC
jgi:hypothetical protein